MAPQNNKFEYFFDLPPELRELILSHICVFPAGILVGGGSDGRSVALRRGAAGVTRHIHHDGTTNHNRAAGNGSSEGGEHDNNQDYEDEDGDYADPPTNLFLASPVLHREAGDLYYARNTFHLSFLAPSSSGRKRTRTRHHRRQQTTPSGSGSSGSSDPGTDSLLRLLTHPETAGARRRIRAAVVAVRRFGAQVQDVVVPALEGMVLDGALRRVRVDVVGPPPVTALRSGWVMAREGGSWMARADHEGNPALRALLVLLADPGLEVVGLRVLRARHARFWCRFHYCQRQQDPPPVGAGGLLEGGDADVDVDVDVGGTTPGTGTACSAAVRREQEEGGWGDGFVEVDIGRLVDVVCAGDAAEFNIKVV
ncbi:uncharacterized protein B0H64DRAFT_437381 [Chaetomium fimeti]|uniref:F-box domain-containing protein n=1 Tax=Chaetomium fimeti TaxID=1854472 RepID=A0AAE0HPV5_9PEZI|nr:hypothetical protein B0H64DRAFT_437381 [Chaetomium fimeti]